jgi:hypothetical protein
MNSLRKHVLKQKILLRTFATNELQAPGHLTENNEIVGKLIAKDFNYFIKEMEQKGVADIVSKLNSVNINVQTKYGRELLLAKDQILRRLVYHERSVEEHQNISINICEGDLFKIYEEHV